MSLKRLVFIFLSATFIFLSQIQFAAAQNGLPFCPGQWVNRGMGMMCQCPDGSFTNLGQAGCPSAPRFQSPAISPHGRNAIPGIVGGVLGILGTLGSQDSQDGETACPAGHSYCGRADENNHICCNPGNICSKFGCIAEGSIDCDDHSCAPGHQCSRDGGCVPEGTADCGSGHYCDAGYYCSTVLPGKCVPENKVDCGSFSCDPGNRCGASHNQCIQETNVEPPHIRPPSSSPREQTREPLPEKIGPSFDCKEAKASLAHIICDHPRLARTDIRYVQAYQALKHQRMQQGQGDKQSKREAADFIQAVATQCGIPAVLDPDATTPESMIECIASAYEAQHDRLQAQLSGDAAEEAGHTVEEHLDLQRMLVELGFLPDTTSVDGVYGPTTRSAISDWQRSRDRSPNGFLGNQDANALKQKAFSKGHVHRG